MSKKLLTSEEVFELREFKDFCRVVGIDTELPIKHLNVSLCHGELVRISIEYYGYDGDSND